MPYPKRFLSDGEEVIREFRPHIKAVFVPMLVFDAVLFLGIIVAVVGPWASWVAVAAAVVVGLAVTAVPVLRWWFTRHIITNERLIVRSGILSKEGKEIPLEVINDVAFSQTFVERLFRSGDLLLESAGELGQSRLTDVPDPEGIQSLVYSLREDRMAALNTGRTPTGDLAALAELHRSGVITEEEYAAKRQKLLDQI